METANMVLIPAETLQTLFNKIDNLDISIKELTNKGKKEYLCRKEVLQMLKINSINTLNTYVEQGFFKAYQPKGKHSKVLYKRAEIECFLNNNPI